MGQQSFDSDFLANFPIYQKGNFYISPIREVDGTIKQVSNAPAKKVELKNSDIVFFNEFLSMFRRKEYTSR